MKLSDRVEAIAPSVTLKIDTQAKSMMSAGIKVINYGVGEPDFPTPDYIVQAAAEAARDPRNHRYTATQGLQELREAIGQKTLRDSGYAVDPEQIVITNGGKQAVYETMQVLLNPGDQVIIPAPYWVSFTEVVKLAGGQPVTVSSGMDQGFIPTVEQLEAARTEKTKALVINSPNNPSGAVWGADRLREVAAWAGEHGLWVIADEIYEHMVYDGAQTAHIGAVCPALRPQLLVLNGVAKTYAMTGWRVGWLIGPRPVAAAAAKLQGHMTSNVNNIAQRAALKAVSGDLSAVQKMRSAFDIRRKTIVAKLNAIPGVSCSLPDGAFYVFPNVSGLLGRPLGPRNQVFSSSADLASALLDQIHIAVVPGEGFGMPGYIRFSYALSDQDLSEGMDRFAAWVGAGDRPVSS